MMKGDEDPGKKRRKHSGRKPRWLCLKEHKEEAKRLQEELAAEEERRRLNKKATKQNKQPPSNRLTLCQQISNLILPRMNNKKKLESVDNMARSGDVRGLILFADSLGVQFPPNLEGNPLFSRLTKKEKLEKVRKEQEAAKWKEPVVVFRGIAGGFRRTRQ